MLEISFALPEPIHIRKYKFTRRQQDSKSNNLIVRQASYRINSTSHSHTDHSLASIDNVFATSVWVVKGTGKPNKSDWIFKINDGTL